MEEDWPDWKRELVERRKNLAKTVGVQQQRRTGKY